MSNLENGQMPLTIQQFFKLMQYCVFEKKSNEHEDESGECEYSIEDELGEYKGFRIGAYNLNGANLAIDLSYKNIFFTRAIDDEGHVLSNKEVLDWAKQDINKWIAYKKQYKMFKRK